MTTRSLLRSLLTATALVLAADALSAQSGEKVLQNLDRNRVALQGHDPVAYFTDGKAVKGNPALKVGYRGAEYHFATPEHRDLFGADPARYAPQFGGYCGYGASRGYPAPIDPEAFTIMNGRLILQNSKGVLRRWQEDPEGYLVKADANWPGIVEKHGKARP